MNTLPPPVIRSFESCTTQLTEAELEPLTVMGTVEPELVNVAEPATVQLPLSVVGQVPVAVSVAVEPEDVKLMLPGTVVILPSHVAVKV
jgi:hypothetical protein